MAVERLARTIDGSLAAGAVGLAVLAAVGAGLGSALAQSRPEVGDRLRAHRRGATPERGLPGLSALQVGLSLVLVVGALLFGRTLRAALDTPLGFEPRGVVAVSLAFQGHGYDRDQVRSALRQILDSVEASPQIEVAAFAAHVPLSPAFARLRPAPVGAPDDHTPLPVAINTVSSGYFDAVRIPFVEGRPFASDQPGATVVVNQAAARLLFPERPAVGQRLVLVRGLPELEVIGIVADHKVHSVADEAVPYVFLPAASNVGVGIATGAHLVARTAGEPRVALRQLRQRVADFDASLPVHDARLVASQVERVLMPQRFGGLLLALLATVAVVIASTGIYATVALGVRRRTSEFGIRMALGAGPRQVAGEAMVRTATATGAGILGGAALATLLSRYVAGYRGVLLPRHRPALADRPISIERRRPHRRGAVLRCVPSVLRLLRSGMAEHGRSGEARDHQAALA